MRKLFVESGQFTEWITEHFDDASYAALQRALAEYPDRGNVIPGCGGLRKLRIGDPGRQQGKRGGARIVYLHVAAADRIYLIAAFGKNEKDDLLFAQKKELRALAKRLESEAIAATRGVR